MDNNVRLFLCILNTTKDKPYIKKNKVILNVEISEKTEQYLKLWFENLFFQKNLS